MTDVRRLFAQYLKQRQSLGEQAFVLEEKPINQKINENVVPAKTVAQVTDPAPSKLKSTVAPDGGELQEPKLQPEEENVDSIKENDADAGEAKWREGAPPIPGPGVTVPAPSSDFFVNDPLTGKSLDDLAGMIRACEKCDLCAERTQAVPGEGPADAKLMVVGEGPGAKEDETGRPFVGRAGELLSGILTAIDCPRESVFIANIVKCRPPGNRTPEQKEIEQCIPYLWRQISLVKPDVILAMGATAAANLLNIRGSLGSMRNQVHSFHGIPLVVTYHPAALLRNPNWKKPTWDDVRIARLLLAGER